MEKKSIKVSIMDTDFVIKSEDSEDYVKQTATQVENSIKTIMRDYRALSAMSASVLVALDYCDQANKFNDDADNLRIQIKECLEENNGLRMDLDDARRENERLKKEINTLRVRFSSGVDDIPVVKEGGAKDSSVEGTSSDSPISRQPAKKSKTTSSSKKNINVKDTNSKTKEPREEILSFFDDEE